VDQHSVIVHRVCLGLALAVMVPLAVLGLAMYWP
jgi:hypothetical protein